MKAPSDGSAKMTRLARCFLADSISPMPSDSLPGQFPSTEWTLVLAAGSDASRAQPALETLCRSYWQPLYTFARRKGLAPETSEDAVQGFIETILARGSLANVEREGGRFRSWLLGGFSHHLANLHRHENRAKRGGGAVPVSLEDAEATLPTDPALTPDEAYDRRWAELVLAAGVKSLRDQHLRTGKAAFWNVLEPVITGRSTASYAHLAETLGITEQAVALHVHRLRVRLKKLVRHEVARTVTSPEELDAEITYLLGLFRR
jgi:DNA-directed RNA polymerase specialized sigma24 family protein